MFRRNTATDLQTSLLVVVVPAVVAIAVAWLLPLHRTLQSGAAILLWLAFLAPWLDLVKG